MKTSSILFFFFIAFLQAAVIYQSCKVISNEVQNMHHNMVSNELSGIRVSSLNVNSLNMSHSNQPLQLRKIFGILKLKSDIILIQDVRISNRNLVNSKDDLVRIFQNNVYGSFTVILNSTKNKRGVAILINNNLSFSEEETVRDVDENIVLSRLRINGKSFIIGSVYGPNNHDQDFFNTLGNLITGLGNHPVIVGGDWNLTPSNLPVDLNPDCCDMGSLPNHRHTEYFNTLCTNLNVQILPKQQRKLTESICGWRRRRKKIAEAHQDIKQTNSLF
jgi:exonuclease III